MNCSALKLLLTAAAVVLLGVTTGVGQTWNKESLAELFVAVAADEKVVAECEKSRRQEQIKKFGKPLPRISGHCFEGCPIRVPKPYYPVEARRWKISGEVIVNTIVDESGNVIFAKVAKGNSFLRREALAAAYQAKYQPKVTCGDRPIRFRWTIRYYFLPSM